MCDDVIGCCMSELIKSLLPRTFALHDAACCTGSTGPLSDLRYMFRQTKEWRQAAEPA